MGDSQEYLLCDTNFFNFTQFERFYIEYYSTVDTDLNLVFRFSYSEQIGNISITNEDFARYEKDYALTELFDTDSLEESWNMNLISMIYSTDEYFPRTANSFSGSMTSAYYNETPYYDGIYSVRLPTHNEGFETYTIDIKNNFDSYYSELRLFCEIWLIHVNKTFVRDYGFWNDEGELIEYYDTEKLRFYPFYENRNEIVIDFNISDYDRSVFESYTQFGDSIAICAHGSVYQNYINYHFRNYTLANYVDYLDIWNYDTSLTSTLKILDNHYHNNNLGANFDIKHAATGWALILNSDKLIHYYKWGFNTQYSDYSEVYKMDKFIIEFTEPRQYYGFYYRVEIANITIDYPQTDLQIYETERDRLDIVYSASETGKEDREAWKVRGDWGALDGLRKGINRILEVFSFIFFLVIGSIEAVALFVEEIEIVVDTISGLITVMDNVVDAILTAVNSALDKLDLVVTAVDAVTSAVGTVLTAIETLIDLQAIALGFQTIVDTISSLLAQVETVVDWIVANVVAFIESAIIFFDFVMSFVPQLLSFYITLVILVVLFMEYQYITEDKSNVGFILTFLVQAVFLPIKIIYTMFKTFVDIIINLIPLT